MDEERRTKLEAGKEIFAKRRKKLKSQLRMKDGTAEGDVSPIQSHAVDSLRDESFSEGAPSDANGFNKVEGASFSDTSQSSTASTASDKLRMEKVLSPRQSETSVREAIDSYKRKLSNYQNALDERDKWIEQMSQRLKEAVQERNHVEQVAERLTEEIMSLQEQLQKLAQHQQQMQLKADEAPHVVILERALSEKEKQVENLQQTVDAQEQEIGVLRQIRDDLLCRITTEPVRESQENVTCTTDVGTGKDVSEMLSSSYATLPEAPVSSKASDIVELAALRKVIVESLTNWAATRALQVENYEDIVTVLDDVKQFAIQGLQHSTVQDLLNEAKVDLEAMRSNAGKLQSEIETLQADLASSQEEVHRLRCANLALQRGSTKLDQEMKMLKRENSMMKNFKDSLNSIKEKVKEEIEEEKVLEVYGLQTECLRLELAKKELEQKTRLLSTSDHSPCVSPTPSSFTFDRTYGHSFTQTEVSIGAMDEQLRVVPKDATEEDWNIDLQLRVDYLKSEKSSLQQTIQQLVAELRQAVSSAEELRWEKGAKDEAVLEKDMIALEKEELQLELQGLQERLQFSEATVEKLRRQLKEEHSSLEKFLAESEQISESFSGDCKNLVTRQSLFVENQRLKCQLTLLKGKLETEVDMCAVLKAQVLRMNQRGDLFQKAIKDLRNCLLCTSDEARKLQARCSTAERKLEQTAAEVKYLKSELCRLRRKLRCIGDQQKGKDSDDDVPSQSSEGLPPDAGAYDSSVLDDGEETSLPDRSKTQVGQLHLKGEQLELLLRSQDLGAQASQELHLCHLREELQKSYCDKLSAMLESVVGCCQQELLAFQQQLEAESSLQLLTLEKKHEEDIIKLKADHKDQMDKLLSKSQPQLEAQEGSQKKEVLTELRAKQQLEYEDLLSCLDPEQKLKLQALVALTLKVHHVENEATMAHTQMRMTSEKERILELLAASNQADKDVLKAKLEYEKKSALKKQHEFFLERERGLKGIEVPSTLHSGLSESGSVSWSTGSSVEGALQLLKDQLDAEFYACADKLAGKWKEKYLNILHPATSENSASFRLPENEPRDVTINLKKHLEDAEEAEELINTFFHLSCSLKDNIQSKLEQILHLYRDCSEESKGILDLNVYPRTDLELEALRTRLEEEHSRQVTQLCSEQVAKTKELLDKHKKELEHIQMSAEEQLAEERRMWSKELDILHNSFQKKEEEALRRSREKEAKISEEMSDLCARHESTLLELEREKDKVKELEMKLEAVSSKQESLTKKVSGFLVLYKIKEVAGKSLPDILDMLMHAHQEAVEKYTTLSLDHENAMRAASQFIIDLGSPKANGDSLASIVKRLIDANINLREDLAGTEKEYESRAIKLALRLEEVEDLYKGKIEGFLQNEEFLVASLKEKEEEHELLKHELQQYVDSVESLKAGHAREIEKLENDLKTRQRELTLLEARQASEMDALKKGLEDALKHANEKHGEDTKKLQGCHRKELDQIMNEHAVELKKLETKGQQELKELKMRCVALEDAVEELKKERTQSRIREGEERLSPLVQGERGDGGDSVGTNAAAATRVELEEDGEYLQVPSLRIRKPSPEWCDLSVEDVLCDRTELQQQVRYHREIAQRLQFEKEQLQEALRKANDQQSKEVVPQSRSPREWLAGSGLTANEIQSWQLHTAQTNTRLLNVLSDLVKTYVDTEQDIQDALARMGLSRRDSPDSAAALEEEYPSLGATSQTHGSKEDFASGLADGFLSELCEDGPDLTPRTWDMFASAIGMQDLESEGEDVVLGASRRLRAAVDRVLRLLADVTEHRGEDFRGLVQRNRDLCQELQEESKVHNQLSLDLLNAQGSIRALEQEKQQLENKVATMADECTKLSRELRLVRAKAQRLEESQETISEERRLLEEQRRILSSSLKEPQLKLLEENTKLNEEKNQLQKCQDEEKQMLLSRIVELEGILEEAAAFKEQLLEERQHEVADLRAQIEGMDKQLQSNKKFIEEQIHEREQEREDFAQEISQLQEIIREKEKIQNCEERLSKEIESLEQQIRLGIEERSVICKKRDQLEAEVRSRDDKIHDLREIIRELESEVGRKSRNEHDLLQKIANMEDALNVEENARSEVTNELEKMRKSSVQPDASEHMKHLEEQLESRNQELDKMVQFQSLLQEFRAQVRSLEEKVESRIQLQQDKHGSFRKFLEIISPEGSRDGATSGQSGASEDAEQQRALSVDDIRDLSPSALQWDELRRLEDKVDTLVSASGELFKDNCRLQKQLKQLERAKKDLEQEKLALQEEGQRQLLQISALKARMEDCRAGLGPAGGSPVSQQLHRLREELLRQKEAREDAEHRLQLSREQLSSLQTRVNAQPSPIGGIRDQQSASLQCHYGPAVFPLQASVMEVDCETEISMEQLCELEEAAAHVEELQKMLEDLTKELEEYRIRCTIQDNEIQSLSNYQDKPSEAIPKESESGRRKLEKDFEEVQEILEEREEELCAAQKRNESQALLEAAVHKLQVDMTDMQREHSRQMEEKEVEAKEQEGSLKGHIKRLRQMLEEQVEKHAQAQEAQRARIAALEEQLDKCIEREEVDSLISRAVTRERDALKLKYEEQLKQTEDSWKSRLESERRKLEQEQLRVQADMQEKLMGSIWSKNQLDKEVQALLEQEKAVLNAQHLNALQNAKRAWEEETKALKSAHAEDIHSALEDLRISLLQIHTDEIEQLKQRLLTTAQEEKLALQRQHDEDIKLLQHSWEQHVQHQMQNGVHRAQEPGSPTQVQALVRQRVEQEVVKLQETHGHEVGQLRKQLEQHEEQRLLQTRALEQELQRNNELLKRQQQCSAELAKVRSDAATMLREERQRMNAWATEQLTAVEDRIRREKAAVAEKADVEKRRLCLEQEQEKRKLTEEHAREVAAMKATHKQEVDDLRTELQRMQLKVRIGRTFRAESSRENTPPSDTSSSEQQTSNCSFDDCCQDSVLSPSLKRLLNKIYKDGLQVLSLTERQLLHYHLAPSPARFEPEGRNDKDFGCSMQREAADQTLPWKLGELQTTPQRRASSGQEADVLALKEQLNRSEWLSKTKCNMLEFQLRQEKMKTEELKKSLEEEVSKNIELLSQLNDQRSACLEVEMSLTSCRADLEELRSKADHARREALRFKNLYETEKVHTRNMLNAYEVERSHFNQLRASLQSERERGASTHERDQQTIKDLKDTSLKWSPLSHQTSPRTANREVETMRNVDRASVMRMGLDSSVHTVTPDREEHETMHLKWLREKDALNQALHKLEEENCRLRSLLSDGERGKSNSVPPTFGNLLYKMYWKYRRTESWRKALAYQKQYLLSLLRGFQATEEATLELLGRGRPRPRPPSGTTRSRTVSPLFRFRSAVRAVLAVQRMCSLVKKWKAAAIIPAIPLVLHKAEQAVHGIPVGAPAPAPASSLGVRQLPPSCVSSVSSSGSPGTLHLRRGANPFHRTAEDHAYDMGEYVTRLEQLHKKFGLDVH